MSDVRKVLRDLLEEQGLNVEANREQLLNAARMLKVDGCYACAFPQPSDLPQNHFHAQIDRAQALRNYFNYPPTKRVLVALLELVGGDS